MNKKATGVDKLSQALLYVVMVFLLVFLGMGIYFTMRGFLDPTMDTRTIGFLGIGIFFFGMGIVVLLQTSMMKSDNSSFLETFFMSNSATEDVVVSLSTKNLPKAKELKPILQFDGHVTIGSNHKICTVMICDDGIWFMNLIDNLVHIKYEDVSDVVREMRRMSITCSCEFADDVYDGVIVIEVENAMRLRAVDEELKKWIN